LKDFINQCFEKNPLFAWRVIDEVAVLVPVKQSGPEIRRLYRLKDPVSTRIWELLDGKRTVQEILQVVCQEFDAEKQRAKRDLVKFLRHLKSIGAVQAVTPSTGKQRSSKPVTERKAKSQGVQESWPTEAKAKVKGPLQLSIGGIGLSLQWEEPREVNWPHPLYEPFLGEESETIRLDIHFKGGPKLNGQKLIFDGEHHWKLYQQDSRYLFEAFDPSSQARNMISLIHPHFDRAEVYVKPGSAGSPPPLVAPSPDEPSWAMAADQPVGRGGRGDGACPGS